MEPIPVSIGSKNTHKWLSHKPSRRLQLLISTSLVDTFPAVDHHRRSAPFDQYQIKLCTCVCEQVVTWYEIRGGGKVRGARREVRGGKMRGTGAR